MILWMLVLALVLYGFGFSLGGIVLCVAVVAVLFSVPRRGRSTAPTGGSSGGGGSGRGQDNDYRSYRDRRDRMDRWERRYRRERQLRLFSLRRPD
ncbi:hypothetical protein ACFWXK_09850 [Streptomyces sp. NPDC059070]|uniref:hypothetical protein n=1 Tax=unclassified Streptomyces TaxID=2593676 RepID=UPI0034E1BD8A